MILEQCKGVHCVDLGESIQTHIYLQILASIQPRTSPVKFTAGLPAEKRAVGLFPREPVREGNPHLALAVLAKPALSDTLRRDRYGRGRG